MSFKDQVAIITGASSGIGHALGRELARQGARVGLLARRRENLEQLAHTITAAGGTVAYAAADVTDRAGTKAAIGQLRQQLGPVDLLIANAGLGKPTYLDQSNVEEVEEMFRVNVFGVIYALEAVLPEMLERRRGQVAAVSSLGSYKGLPGESGYCATKAAVNCYMEGLRIQLRPYGIAATTICPGFIKTPMTEAHKFAMPFLLEADEAARRIVHALERRAKVFNFPWPMTWLMKLTQWLPDGVVLRRLGKYVETESPRQKLAASEPAAETVP